MKIKPRLLAYCLYKTRWAAQWDKKPWGHLTKDQRRDWAGMAVWVIRALKLYRELRGR